MIMFTSNNPRTREFLAIGRLIGFLESSADKEEKVREIKAARETGLVNDDEALDLIIEFC